jgi:hypothetical protein
MKTTHSTWRSLSCGMLALALMVPARYVRAQEDPNATPGTAPAAPSPGAQCAAAYEQAQTDKLAGHYVSATAAALACSQIECNQAIVRECLQLYEKLEQETPSFVFAARKGEGGELIDVRVDMDGKVISEQITGRPFKVDPGPHEFVFSHPQRGRMQTNATARVGERARVVEVTFADPNAKPAPAPLAPAPVPAAPQAEPKRGVPVMTYVLGGIGLAAAGSFLYFRLTAVSDYNDYNATCAPTCNPDDVDAVRTKFLISNVSLGVGIASLAGAGLVYAFGRGGGDKRVEASITPRADGAMAGVRTRF